MKYNEFKLSLIVSNDREYNGQTIPAVKKVSENMTTIKAFLPGKKNTDGSYGPSLNFEIRQTSKTKVETNIACGAHIDVFGFLAADQYDNREGKKVVTQILVATSISKTDYEGTTGNAGDASATAPAPTSNAGSSAQPSNNDFMNIDYSDELPFS